MTTLAAQGYGLTTFGLDSHWLTLYTHKDVNDKKRGEAAFKALVNDPKAINAGEGYYLAKKASQGFFPWKPEDCLARKFENVQYVKDKLGGTRVVRSEPYMGCKWCRALEIEVKVEPKTEMEIEIVTVAAPVAEPPAGLTCGECGWMSKVGKSAKNSLRFHMTKRHQRATAQAVPA